MRLYLDDDSASRVLRKLLLAEKFNVTIPADVGLSGSEDPVHLAQAIVDDRITLSGNHKDFEKLHDLVMVAGGHHPGIFVVHRENNPRRDLTAKGIVVAINNIAASGVATNDGYFKLNEWR